MRGYRLLAAVSVSGLFAVTLAAAPPRGLDEASFRRLTRVGPFTTEIQGKATFRVPTDYRMVVADKLEEFGELTGFPVLGDEAGYIGKADRPTWFAVLLVVTDDPLKGIDAKNIAEPAVRAQLLDWQRRFHEGRRPRKGVLSISSKVAAWTHPPKWDEKTKVLTMGVRLEGEADGQKDKVNYQSFAYGPGGAIIVVSAFADVENYDKAEKESGKLTDEFSFIAPPPAEEPAAEAEDDMHMVKVAGGGLAGAVVVLLMFKFMGTSGGRGRTPARARRPAR
jgi:uncharacterized membrane-anchored protein